MKKLLEILLSLAIITLSGCVDKNKPIISLPYAYDDEGKPVRSDYNYFEATIEGCQYILIGGGPDRVFTHKGNCNNPIHFYNVETQEHKQKDTNYINNIITSLNAVEKLIQTAKDEANK